MEWGIGLGRAHDVAAGVPIAHQISFERSPFNGGAPLALKFADIHTHTHTLSIYLQYTYNRSTNMIITSARARARTRALRCSHVNTHANTATPAAGGVFDFINVYNDDIFVGHGRGGVGGAAGGGGCSISCNIPTVKVEGGQAGFLLFYICQSAAAGVQSGVIVRQYAQLTQCGHSRFLVIFYVFRQICIIFGRVVPKKTACGHKRMR